MHNAVAGAPVSLCVCHSPTVHVGACIRLAFVLFREFDYERFRSYETRPRRIDYFELRIFKRASIEIYRGRQ